MELKIKKHKRKIRLNSIYLYQVLILLAFTFIYFIFDFFNFWITPFLVAPIVGSIFFLAFRFLFHKLNLSWIILGSILSVLLMDFLAPRFLPQLESGQLEAVPGRIWLIFLISLIEIFLEEEAEVMEKSIDLEVVGK